jgi:DNA invertase Pin-like site-specific DNA recombinase
MQANPSAASVHDRNGVNEMKDTKITALYERLSRDDCTPEDSVSIINQRKILEKYATENGFTNIRHFQDDGWSGKDFQRPGWQELIAEIEAGNVATLITKNLDRVGRNYLQVGFYTEVFFREKGVRFIAVSNNIDSANGDDSMNEFAPFLNIMSEWYLRDASRKVKAVFKSKGMSGQRLTFKPIYGYLVDPDDKSKWIIDPIAAPVVRRIFSMTIDGIGSSVIARRLMEDRIERPSYYQQTHGIVNNEQYDMTRPFAWAGSTIAHILRRPEYCGHTVNFRTYKDSYKDKRPKKTAKEDLVIFRDTHPAIVSEETYELAQTSRQTKRRTDHGEANPLTGKIFCHDCKAKMYNHRQPEARTVINKKGYVCHRSPKDVYDCSTYTLSRRKFDAHCTSHTIRTAVLRDIVLAVIKAASAAVNLNEEEFMASMRKISVVQQEETAAAHRKQIKQSEKRIAELNTLIRRIYEDNVSGKLTDKRFAALSAEYENEQTELEQTVIRLQAELDVFAEDNDNSQRFVEIVRKYTDFTELTPAMIAEFIDRIEVHAPDKSSGEREQQVDVYLNFVGQFDLPIPELSPEEMEAEEWKRRKRERCREAQRRYQSKKRAEREAQEQGQTQLELVSL